MPQYVEYYYLYKFLHAFADKAIVVDPLDRELWSIEKDTQVEEEEECNEDDDQPIQDNNDGVEIFEEEIKYVDQSTKYNDVKQMIANLVPVDGKNLSVPLSEQSFQQICKMFEKELDKVVRQINEQTHILFANENAIE